MLRSGQKETDKSYRRASGPKPPEDPAPDELGGLFFAQPTNGQPPSLETPGRSSMPSAGMAVRSGEDRFKPPSLLSILRPSNGPLRPNENDGAGKGGRFCLGREIACIDNLPCEAPGRNADLCGTGEMLDFHKH